MILYRDEKPRGSTLENYCPPTNNYKANHVGVEDDIGFMEYEHKILKRKRILSCLYLFPFPFELFALGFQYDIIPPAFGQKEGSNHFHLDF